MPALLTAASSLSCPHGAPITATPGSTKAQAAAPILRASDSFVIAGCPFTLPGPVPNPCTTINWVTTAMQVQHDGVLVLNTASVGLCIGANQAPQGTVLINAAQPLVNGL